MGDDLVSRLRANTDPGGCDLHNAADIIEEQAAELASLRARDWQPIEAAPKDGTRILVFGPSNLANKTYMDVCAWPDNWSGKWPVAYMAYAADEPTHWMPLPEPPKI